MDKSSSVHTDNKKKNILVLGECQTQRLNDTLVTAEAKYFVNFTKSRRINCVSLCHNERSNFLDINGAEIYQLKAKDSEIKTCSLSLSSISNDFMVNIIKNWTKQICI